MALSRSVSDRVQESIERAGLDPQQILLCSSVEIRRLANLPDDDIEMVKMKSAEQHAANKFLLATNIQLRFVSTGCKVLDEYLGGGFAHKGITEVAGESGAGKTQLCLQATLSVQLPSHAGDSGTGAVYICTEDIFPSTRLQQLLQSWPGMQRCPNAYRSHNFMDNIFIEHIADVDSLKNCIFVRLPNLLHQHQIGLIVVDSIAGPFRADYDLRHGAVTRAQDLKSIGQQLCELANLHNLAVICVNQVSAVQGENRSLVVPALGLVWANVVTTRFQLYRTGRMVSHPTLTGQVSERQLEVVFCPYLPAKSHPFIVTETGVQGLTKPTT